MNKTKVLLSNSIYLIAVYPLTVIQSIFMKSVEKSADIVPTLVFLKIAFKKLSNFCPSVGR
jgi:hypothetical protein